MIPGSRRLPRRGPPRSPPRSPARILAWPALIALASCAGLFLGLTGAGWQDAAACALLSLPILAAAICWWRRD